MRRVVAEEEETISDDETSRTSSSSSTRLLIIFRNEIPFLHFFLSMFLLQQFLLSIPSFCPLIFSHLLLFHSFLWILREWILLITLIPLENESDDHDDREKNE